MSAFEAACWNWHQEMVNSFSMESGVAGELVREERLRGAAKRLFIRALGAIHGTIGRVELERMKSKREAGG